MGSNPTYAALYTAANTAKRTYGPKSKQYYNAYNTFQKETTMMKDEWKRKYKGHLPLYVGTHTTLSNRRRKSLRRK